MNTLTDYPTSPAGTLPGPTDALSPRRFAILLGFIALVALALRVWHIAWGLPGIFEEAYPFMKAWGFWNWGAPGVDLNPHFFNYPALTFYFHWGVQGIRYAAGHLFGIYPDVDAFRAAFEADPTRAIVFARMLNTAFDVGTVIAIASVARRLTGAVPALAVAGLSAVNPLQVLMSQQVNVDVPMTFFLVLALWCVLHVYDHGAFWGYVGAGVAIGLAAASKYTAAILLVPLLVAHLLRVYHDRGFLRSIFDARLLSAVMVAEILFLALNPYILLDVAAFKRGFGFELEHMSAGHFGIRDNSSSIGYYLTEIIPANLGWVLAVAAIAGLVSLFMQKGRIRRWLPPLTYLAILLGLLLLWKMRADRYFLPLLPGIFLLIAAALEKAFALLPNRFPGWRTTIRGRLTGGALALLCILAMGGESLRSVWGYHVTAGKPDTRTIARAWIGNQYADDIVVVAAPLGLTVPPPGMVFLLPYVAVDFQLLEGFYDARWYVDFDLVAGSDFDRGRYLTEPEKFGPFLRYFYDSLNTVWQRVGTIEPGTANRGPSIWLYAPPDVAQVALFDESLFRRLDDFPDMSILARFGLNMTLVLTHKGMTAKADQVWDYVTVRTLAHRDPVALLGTFLSFPEAIKAVPRMHLLIRQLAVKAAKGLTVGPMKP